MPEENTRPGLSAIMVDLEPMPETPPEKPVNRRYDVDPARLCEVLLMLEDVISERDMDRLQQVRITVREWAALLEHPEFKPLIDAILVMYGLGVVKTNGVGLDAFKMLAQRVGSYQSGSGMKPLRARRVIIHEAEVEKP